MQRVGSFQVENGLIISDPSYNFDLTKYGTGFKIQDYFSKDKVMTGEWDSYVEYDEESGRVAMLRALNSDITYRELDELKWEACDGFIGVDTGQAGIYDSKYFKDDSIVGDYPLAEYITNIDEKGEKWYSMCCQQTYDESNPKKRAGTIPYGVVSSSGWGDGAYDYGVTKKNGLICGVEVLFLFKYNNNEENE